MMAAKNYTMMLIMISIAFALGWSMRGDKIYSEMFNGMTYMAADMKAVK